MAERILSVFVDEAGNFGAYTRKAPYYVVSMVLHDQRVSIKANIDALNLHMLDLGYPDHAIHAGPLIRWEEPYRKRSRDERKKLFDAIFTFTRQLDCVSYLAVCVFKQKDVSHDDFVKQVSNAIKSELQAYKSYVSAFDQIIIYYDNGQAELRKILSVVFPDLLGHVTLRRVRPVDYKLFQVADLVCTVEWIANSDALTEAERVFFSSRREFIKNYLKPLRRKHLPL